MIDRRDAPVLAAGVLILAVALVVSLFVPLFPCPSCAWMRDLQRRMVVATPNLGGGQRSGSPSLECPKCWKGRVSFYQRWRNGR